MYGKQQPFLYKIGYCNKLFAGFIREKQQNNAFNKKFFVFLHPEYANVMAIKLMVIK